MLLETGCIGCCTHHNGVQAVPASLGYILLIQTLAQVCLIGKGQHSMSVSLCPLPPLAYKLISSILNWLFTRMRERERERETIKQGDQILEITTKPFLLLCHPINKAILNLQVLFTNRCTFSYYFCSQGMYKTDILILRKKLRQRNCQE